MEKNKDNSNDANDFVEWAMPSNVKCTHLLKLLSFMLRLFLCMFVLIAFFMLLSLEVYTGGIKVRQVLWGGLFTPSRCFFITSEEVDISMEVELFSARVGEETFCGLTAEEVASYPSELWGTSFMEVLFGWPFFFFAGAMFFALTFMCFSWSDLVNTMRSKYVGLPTVQSWLRTTWCFLYLTLLPSYLISPMSSVRVLPEPANHIAMIRTPPDYGFVQMVSIFLSMPTCCVIWGTCFCVSKGQNVHDAGGPCYSTILACTACVAIPIVLVVIVAYAEMGNIFFIDWQLTLAFDLSFVAVAMIAKFFLGAAGVVDSLMFVIDMCQNSSWCKEETQRQVAPAPAQYAAPVGREGPV
mmetsp:Transcript_3720/g.6698  ORF Transcript_3720/g.6698 Transcript_3720/m.6698 type:complete len:354 (-) Transcript_3720:78-1139(-)